MFLQTPEVLSREPYGHAVDWWSLGVLTCRMLTNQYPTPAIRKRAMIDNEETKKGSNNSPASANSNDVQRHQHNQVAAGTLPDGAASLSSAARGLLLRLLERDPRVRMRNLRQLQQSAFYMGYNFQHVKTKKVAPKSLLEKHFPESISDISELPVEDLCIASEEMFSTFSQPALV